MPLRTFTPEQEQFIREVRESLWRALTEPDARTPEMEAEWNRIIDQLLRKLVGRITHSTMSVYYDGLARGLGDAGKLLPRGAALEAALETMKTDKKAGCFCLWPENHTPECIAATKALLMWRELFK